MKKSYIYLSLYLALLISPNSHADEMWNSTYGKVIYESDIGTTALWSYNYQGIAGLIYINNLAGIYENRTAYQGYWIQATSDVKCRTTRLMGGRQTAYWGWFNIQFLDPNFPARWQAKWGYCDENPNKLWQGTPITNR